MLDLKESEMNWVIKHLGHSMNVHETHYRLLNSTIERAKVAKLLLLIDNGKASQFIGKKLEDVRFEGKTIFK